MAIPKQIPTEGELEALISPPALLAWKAMARRIDALYDMEAFWSDSGKKWKYEYKYRRGGKTLCALYAAQGRFGCMMIFGGEERERVEALRPTLQAATLAAYDEAVTYHDGKWVMFDETLDMEDMTALLAVKRKPNRKEPA